MKLQYSVILSFSLPACILLFGYGQPVYAFSEQKPCLPGCKNALEQLERGENAPSLLKIQQSASRGNNVGLSCLAYLHLMGWGVEGSEKKAWELFQKAAKAGNAAAMHRIGTMYELGTYVDKDYTWAMLWHLRSAVRDHADAQSTVGIFYEDGLAGYRDVTAALFWYKKAAAQGDLFAIEAVQRLEKTIVTTDD
jgi:TPR repeat protein